MTLPAGYPVAPADPLVDTIRYTTLDAVKRALGITDNSWDTEATQAIVALEGQMDQFVGGTFTTGEIPETVKQAALLGGMEVFKLMDAPGGVAGSDSDGFMGVWEPGQASRAAFNTVKPLLAGYRISWGTA